MTDDGGVLGNLPNSRPGQRSEKRKSAKPGTRAAGAASPKPAPRKRAAAAKKPGPGAPVPPPATADPVGAVVRTATGAAATGVRVAGALSRELFKRLPRP